MKEKTRDNVIYLGVGLAIAAGFTMYMLYTERTTGMIREIPGPILWGILSTPGIVALVLERFWEHRRRRALWGILIIVALVNISAMFTAYYRRWNPPVLVWSTMSGLGVVVVFVVAQKLLGRDRSDRKSSR